MEDDEFIPQGQISKESPYVYLEVKPGVGYHDNEAEELDTLPFDDEGEE